jgi:hypothetical protein
MRLHQHAELAARQSADDLNAAAEAALLDLRTERLFVRSIAEDRQPGDASAIAQDADRFDEIGEAASDQWTNREDRVRVNRPAVEAVVRIQADWNWCTLLGQRRPGLTRRRSPSLSATANLAFRTLSQSDASFAPSIDPEAVKLYAILTACVRAPRRSLPALRVDASMSRERFRDPAGRVLTASAHPRLAQRIDREGIGAVDRRAVRRSKSFHQRNSGRVREDASAHAVVDPAFGIEGKMGRHATRPSRELRSRNLVAAGNRSIT